MALLIVPLLLEVALLIVPLLLLRGGLHALHRRVLRWPCGSRDRLLSGLHRLMVREGGDASDLAPHHGALEGLHLHRRRADQQTVNLLDGQLRGLLRLVVHEAVAARVAGATCDLAGRDVAEQAEAGVQRLVVDLAVQVLHEHAAGAREDAILRGLGARRGLGVLALLGAIVGALEASELVARQSRRDGRIAATVREQSSTALLRDCPKLGAQDPILGALGFVLHGAGLVLLGAELAEALAFALALVRHQLVELAAGVLAVSVLAAMVASTVEHIALGAVLAAGLAAASLTLALALAQGLEVRDLLLERPHLRRLAGRGVVAVGLGQLVHDRVAAGVLLRAAGDCSGLKRAPGVLHLALDPVHLLAVGVELRAAHQRAQQVSGHELLQS